MQVHLDQLAHVQKGCLARSNQSVRSDGSRIEGSHKGWNSLQRSFASGIVLTQALSHDFVLRRNCRMVAESKDRTHFDSSTHHSHHVRLVSRIAETWNLQVSSTNGGGQSSLTPLPRLQIVDSGEKFGLVASEYTASFKGLLEIEEIKEEDPFERLDGVDTENDNCADTKSLMQSVSNLDPILPTQPETGIPGSSRLTTRNIRIPDPSTVESMIIMSPSASPAPTTAPTPTSHIHHHNSTVTVRAGANQLGFGGQAKGG